MVQSLAKVNQSLGRVVQRRFEGGSEPWERGAETF